MFILYWNYCYISKMLVFERPMWEDCIGRSTRSLIPLSPFFSLHSLSLYHASCTSDAVWSTSRATTVGSAAVHNATHITGGRVLGGALVAGPREDGVAHGRVDTLRRADGHRSVELGLHIGNQGCSVAAQIEGRGGRGIGGPDGAGSCWIWRAKAALRGRRD